MVCRDKIDELVFLVIYIVLSIVYFVIDVYAIDFLDIFLYILSINPEIRDIIVELGQNCGIRDCYRTLKGEIGALLYSVSWLLVILIIAMQGFFDTRIILLLIMMVLPEVRFGINFFNGKLQQCPTK